MPAARDSALTVGATTLQLPSVAPYSFVRYLEQSGGGVASCFAGDCTRHHWHDSSIAFQCCITTSSNRQVTVDIGCEGVGVGVGVSGGHPDSETECYYDYLLADGNHSDVVGVNGNDSSDDKSFVKCVNIQVQSDSPSATVKLLWQGWKMQKSLTQWWNVCLSLLQQPSIEAFYLKWHLRFKQGWYVTLILSKHNSWINKIRQ